MRATTGKLSKAITVLVLSFALVWVVVSLMLSSTSRDRRGDAISSAGYSFALRQVDMAMEQYALHHYGQVPESIEQLAAAELSELGAEDDEDPRRLPPIVSRTVIKPLFIGPD